MTNKTVKQVLMDPMVNKVTSPVEDENLCKHLTLVDIVFWPEKKVVVGVCKILGETPSDLGGDPRNKVGVVTNNRRDRIIDWPYCEQVACLEIDITDIQWEDILFRNISVVLVAGHGVSETEASGSLAVRGCRICLYLYYMHSSPSWVVA